MQKEENMCANKNFTFHQKIVELLEEKDLTIKCLETHVTKYKAEHAKDVKAIQNLQDKLTQLAPNSNNTGSTFMLASEFKDFFDLFMKETLSTAFGTLLSYPKTYTKYAKIVLSTVYCQIKTKIDSLTSGICK